MKITQYLFNQILKKNFIFESKPQIAVGVSGGPDSMALLILLNNWIKKNNGSLIALIVDHGIREDSKNESKVIKKYLTNYKIQSHIFSVNKRDVNKKNMNEARENRLKKLVDFCKANNIFHLFIGHHYDDNLETFILRKIAGSNFEGLSGIKIKSILNGIQILRPMIVFKKKNILEYNHNNKISYLNDPSNNNLKYSRVAVRNFLIQNNSSIPIIEKDFDQIKKYFPYYKKMIYHFFIKMNLCNLKNKILIDKKIFFKHNIQIQTKIIEIIYNFLMPNKGFLRYKKMIKLLVLLSNKDEISTNLGGMIIKKDYFLITFSV